MDRVAAAGQSETGVPLDSTVASVDPATRQSMLTNLRVNREIIAAWAERGAGADADDDADDD